MEKVGEPRSVLRGEGYLTWVLNNLHLLGVEGTATRIFQAEQWLRSQSSGEPHSFQYSSSGWGWEDWWATGLQRQRGAAQEGCGYQTKELGFYLVGQSFSNHTPWNTKGLLSKDGKCSMGNPYFHYWQYLLTFTEYLSIESQLGNVTVSKWWKIKLF